MIKPVFEKEVEKEKDNVKNEEKSIINIIKETIDVCKFEFCSGTMRYRDGSVEKRRF